MCPTYRAMRKPWVTRRTKRCRMPEVAEGGSMGYLAEAFEGGDTPEAAQEGKPAVTWGMRRCRMLEVDGRKHRHQRFYSGIPEDGVTGGEQTTRKCHTLLEAVAGRCTVSPMQADAAGG
eukprot:1147823-Pelagomonas_calceolata.AAC.8